MIYRMFYTTDEAFGFRTMTFAVAEAEDAISEAEKQLHRFIGKGVWRYYLLPEQYSTCYSIDTKEEKG